VAALRERAAAAQAADTTTSEEEPASSEPASGGMPESSRKKWLGRMFQLLAEADCPDREDQVIVISALAGGRTDADLLEHRDAVTDDELRNVVNALNAASKEGTLGGLVTDLINSHALRVDGSDGESA